MRLWRIFIYIGVFISVVFLIYFTLANFIFIGFKEMLLDYFVDIYNEVIDVRSIVTVGLMIGILVCALGAIMGILSLRCNLKLLKIFAVASFFTFNFMLFIGILMRYSMVNKRNNNRHNDYDDYEY